MKRSWIGWAVVVLIAIAGSAFAWVWFAGGSGEPTTGLTTPTIGGGDTTTTTGETDGSATTSDEGPEAPSEEISFVIDSAQSTASFTIDEELRGSPNTVVGETDQVAGQLLVDLSDLSTAQISDVVINARTFRTDSERRDRAIRGPVILNSASDEFELITFTVTSIEGLEGSAGPGDTFQFGIIGDLTIRDTTNRVEFGVEATLVDASSIGGTAQTQVLRSDFGIGIPSVPGVANVTDEVTLTLDFVAVAD